MTNERGANLDAYERRIGRWSRRAAEQFVDWLDVAEGRNWLDVGAGTGALTAAISATPRRAWRAAMTARIRGGANRAAS